MLSGIFGQKTTWIADKVLRRRRYGSYEDYLAHQASKLDTIKGLDGYHQKFKATLRKRLEESSERRLSRGSTVLCLGARTGAECEAFIEMGCVAIGVDLNPGRNNKYVVTGDFHNLQFADSSLDFIYTNALDHSFEIEKVISEIHRVLKSDGVFVAEIVRGSSDENGREPGEYESVWWDSIEQVIASITSSGFRIIERSKFTYPWGGDHVKFLKP